MEDKQIVDLLRNALKLQYRKRNINTEGIAAALLIIFCIIMRTAGNV